MNDPEVSHTHAGILEQISALQRQVFTLLLVLVVVSGTLVAFLYYQSRQLGKSIDGYMQVMQTYKQDFPIIQAFVKQATVYGTSHPDFQLILKKYGISNVAPAAPVAPKK
jgi:cell division protein FtsL